MPTNNEALLEANASCPPSARICCTLEDLQASANIPCERLQAKIDLLFCNS